MFTKLGKHPQVPTSHISDYYSHRELIILAVNLFFFCLIQTLAAAKKSFFLFLLHLLGQPFKFPTRIYLIWGK